MKFWCSQESRWARGNHVKLIKPDSERQINTVGFFPSRNWTMGEKGWLKGGGQKKVMSWKQRGHYLWDQQEREKRKGARQWGGKNKV